MGTCSTVFVGLSPKDEDHRKGGYHGMNQSPGDKKQRGLRKWQRGERSEGPGTGRTWNLRALQRTQHGPRKQHRSNQVKRAKGGREPPKVARLE